MEQTCFFLLLLVSLNVTFGITTDAFTLCVIYLRFFLPKYRSDIVTEHLSVCVCDPFPESASGNVVIRKKNARDSPQ